MQIDHIGLSVGNLEQQLAWYQDAFGLVATEPFEVPSIGLRGAFLTGPDGIAIELLERSGSRQQSPATSAQEDLLAQGWAHVCFRVENVDEIVKRLVSIGARVVGEPGPSPEPGVRFAFVLDPEGNFIELLDRPHPVIV